MLANHPNVLSGGGVATNIIGGTGLFADGTVAAPSISFLADQDTGIYRIGENNIGVAAGGAKVLDVATTGLGITGLATISSTTASTGVGTGALQVAGGIGVAGQSYFGTTLSVARGSVPIAGEMITIGNNYDPATIGKFYAVGNTPTFKYIQGGWNVATYGTGRSGYMVNGVSGICGHTNDGRTEITCGTGDTIYFGGLNQNGFTNTSATLTAFGQINATGFTVAGAVAISSTTAGSSGAGALVVAGGISAGNTGSAASYFGGALNVAGAATFAGSLTVSSTETQRIGGATRFGNNDNAVVEIEGSGTNRILFYNRTSSAYLDGNYDALSHTFNVNSAPKFTLASTGNATFAGAVTIGNTVNTVSPTSPNRTITMVVNGVTLYLAAKTTND